MFDSGIRDTAFHLTGVPDFDVHTVIFGAALLYLCYITAEGGSVYGTHGGWAMDIYYFAYMDTNPMLRADSR